MPESTKVVEVLPYDDNWKQEFEKIRDMLKSYIGDLIVRIEHVGSTSVEGLSAKPIIDVDVVIESYDVLPQIIEKLELEGYIYEGNLGIEGREAFRRKYDDGMMKYHLYVCPKDGKGYLEHIAFRDYLRNNEDARKEYSRLKKQLAIEYRYDIDNYCDKKTDFIRNILTKTLYKDDIK
ncbi:GrpB family protein [Tissierella sp. MSJ-40]|uniref:GrpB family protein n=1 Tax=Tissierella simiarum TaxID=2841534 RepID=A0ABS6E8G7_9FIRM|nr:GrpB family protein [Tissierella simiarum]MBU5439201.1 GrpB family protein [Tissierella simiarum]